MPPGPSTLVVSAPGRDSVVRGSVRAREGEVRDVGTITLGRGLVLSGIVVDAEGQPVANADVVAAPRPVFGLTGVLFGSAPVRAAADGRFEIAGLPPTEDVIVAARRDSGSTVDPARPRGP